MTRGRSSRLETNSACTKLSAEQVTTIDFAQRQAITDQMQAMFPEASPSIILAYPYQLEVYHAAKWTGWTHSPPNVPGWQGAVLYNYKAVRRGQPTGPLLYTEIVMNAVSAGTGARRPPRAHTSSATASQHSLGAHMPSLRARSFVSWWPT